MVHFLMTSLFFSLFFSCALFKEKNLQEYQVQAYLWQQTSGEYRALTYQAYNMAKEILRKDLFKKRGQKRAVVFDIDETILDNSYGGAKRIKEKIPWEKKHFSEWVKLKMAVAIPGALEFVQFLEKEHIEIFYISNRNIKMFEDTYENLIAEKFPVKKENLLLLDADESKDLRRKKVLEKFDVVLYLGDNLSDFPGGFERLEVEKRNALVDKLRDDFGQKFIIIPNPLYGDWERALPQNKNKIDLLKVKP